MLLGVPFLILVSRVVASRFDPAVDPHGYALIFGVLLSVPLGLGIGLVAPLVLPRARRRSGYTASMSICGAIVVGLFALWFTA